MTTIPFYRPSLAQSEIDAVVECLQSGWLTTASRCKQFEADFGRYLHHKHAVALNSGTAALHLALEAIGLKQGQTVVVPTMTFAASAEVVRYFNAHPLLVDCRPADFNLDVADARRRIDQAVSSGNDVVAIMPVHYGGQVADVTGVATLAREYQLKIVEDAAHCCPAFYREESTTQGTEKQPSGGRKQDRLELRTPNLSDGWKTVGSSADISCFSFYANKCITTGEGGMACTERDDYAERMRIMSLHGISKDAWKRFSADGSWYYEIIAPGYKYNLTDIAAAIGIHQLRRADEMHRKRQKLAAYYRQLLENVDELMLPAEMPNRIHAWHLFAVRLKLERLKIDRAQVIQELKQRGIGTSVHWMPLHIHPYYREKYKYSPDDFPVAAAVYPQLITLPLFPDMTEGELCYVCDSLKEIIAKHLK